MGSARNGYQLFHGHFLDREKCIQRAEGMLILLILANRKLKFDGILYEISEYIGLELHVNHVNEYERALDETRDGEIHE